MTVTRIAISAVRRIMISTFGVAKPIVLITEIALGEGSMNRTVTEMLEAEMFLIALGIGLLVYAVRDGLADIKHEIWELRMDLRDKDGDGE